jgi:hypothetical protein
MSVSKSLFGATVNVPTRGEKGWGTEGTNILVQLIDFANGAGNLVSGVAFVNQAITATVATAGSTINPTHNVIVITAASAVTLSGSLPVANRTSSFTNFVILIGTSDTNTITILDGGNVLLNGDCVLGVGHCLSLVWDGSQWIELFRNN